MSEENVEFVRAASAPFDGLDVGGIDWDGEAIREILERWFSPDVELTTLESGIGIGPSRSYAGWDGLVRYFKKWFGPFSEYRMDFLDYIDAGDRVIVPMRAWGIGRGSGIRVEMELVLSHEVRGGR